LKDCPYDLFIVIAKYKRTRNYIREITNGKFFIEDSNFIRGIIYSWPEKSLSRILSSIIRRPIYITTNLILLYSFFCGNRFRSNIIGVPTFIIKRIGRIDKKSRDYRNSGVRLAYKLVTSLYMSSAIFKNSKIISDLGIFFTMASLIITIVVF